MEYEYLIDSLRQLIDFIIKRNDVVIMDNEPVKIDGETYKTTVFHGLFPTGKMVMSRGVHEWINDDDNDEQHQFRTLYIQWLLLRHVTGDWGNLCIEDYLVNEQSLRDHERMMSVYEYEHTTFWIITEWDRSLTTVLLPSEY